MDALLVAPGRRRDGRDDLGHGVVVDADRAAALRLDGRDPVPHAAVGGHVQGPRAVARARARPAAAHEHHRLHDLRRRVGLVGRHLRDDRQDDAARARSARLPGDDHDRHARRRRHARPADPAVDHHDRLRRHARTCRSRSCSSPASFPASCWRCCSPATSSPGRCSIPTQIPAATERTTLRAEAPRVAPPDPGRAADRRRAGLDLRRHRDGDRGRGVRRRRLARALGGCRARSTGRRSATACWARRGSTA